MKRAKLAERCSVCGAPSPEHCGGSPAIALLQQNLAFAKSELATEREAHEHTRERLNQLETAFVLTRERARKLREALTEDASGQPVPDLLDTAAGLLFVAGGGPVEDRLRAAATSLRAALGKCEKTEPPKVQIIDLMQALKDSLAAKAKPKELLAPLWSGDAPGSLCEEPKP